MSLLRRLAISNGNRDCKESAHSTLKQMEREVVVTWNRELQAEIQHKAQQSKDKRAAR